MEIKQIQRPLSVSAIALGSKSELSTLTLNQLLDVKVVSTETDSNTFDFKSIALNQSIKVQSNLPLTLKNGQLLQLIVSQTQPAVEFKLANNDPQDKNLKLLQSQVPLKDLSQLSFKAITAVQAKPISPVFTSSSQPRLLEALVLSRSQTEIILELNKPISEYSNEIASLIRPHPVKNNSLIMTLTPRLLQASTAVFNTSHPKPQAIDLLKFQPGQKIQLEIGKNEHAPPFKILQPTVIKLQPGQVLFTRVAQINNNNLQLHIQAIQNPQSPSSPTVTMAVPTPLATQSNTAIQPLPILDIKANQLLQTETQNTVKQAAQFTNDLKLNQQLLLEVVKTGSKTEFKRLDVKTTLPVIEQTISAKILTFDEKTIQLQLPKPSALEPNQQSATPAVMLINKSQINSFSAVSMDSKTHSNSTPELKPGQLIQLKVIKQGRHTSFEIMQPQSFTQQQLLETVKQLLPIQQTPPALLNQIIKNQALMATNEKIPEKLKRLAAEIINSLPQLKELKTPQQLQKAMTQSGVFLENKLVQSLAPDVMTVSADFKGLLLKFQQTLTTQLKTKPKQQMETDALELIKELQKKTDSSLAKIILNQLASLPKEENNRQIWLLDLPFFNQEQAESVNIKIDRDPRQSKEKEPDNWSVTLTLTPPKLGTIHCKISCYNETVNTRFWSDSELTTQEINSHLNHLKTQMQKAGIKTGHLSANTGKSETASEQQSNHPNLLDQRV